MARPSTTAHPDASPAERSLSLSLASLWSLVAALLPGVASLGVAMSTIDLAYHLRAGAITLREGAPLARDPFTFTAAGAPWLNQQWGAQVLLWLAYRAGAWTGLALLRAALIAGTYAALVATCRRRGSRARDAALLCAGGFLLAAPYLGLRPQLFGVLLFALFVAVLDLRDRRPGWLWALPPLSALWANLHGSFPLGLALLGLAGIEDRSRADLRRRIATVAALALLGTFVNPFGPRVWAYALGLTTDPFIARAITEWAPPNARTLPGALFFASTFALAGWMILKPVRPPGTTVLKAGLFATLGLFAVRGIVWWAVALPVLVAEARGEAPTVAPEREATRSPLNAAILAVLAGLATLFLLRWTDARGNDLIATAPSPIAQVLEAELRPGDRIFAAQIWGSWLEFALPENPVFVDSRIELFPGRVWDQYYDVSNGREGWQAVLDRWDVAAVAADREQQGGLIPRIRRDPGWRLVYEGPEGLVFVRA